MAGFINRNQLIKNRSKPAGFIKSEPEISGMKNTKIFGSFLDLCVSSLSKGHANFLCIVPILLVVVLEFKTSD
jgi:hypothetical protein